jgi:hypothetical protein
MSAMVLAPQGIAPNVGTYLVKIGSRTGEEEAIQIVRINNPLTSPSFELTFVLVGDIDDRNGPLRIRKMIDVHLKQFG